MPSTNPEPRRPVHYALIIRVPFPRGSFVDPPQVDWDAGKDRRLWKIISRTPKPGGGSGGGGDASGGASGGSGSGSSSGGSIDWAKLASEFGVTQSFLLTQAAWLYECHLEQVKAQMSKIRSSNAPTPVQAGGGLNPGVAKRLGSGGASRAPSSLSVRSRDSPAPGSTPGTPRAQAPPISRTPSATTITQSRHFLPPSPRQRSARTVGLTTLSTRKQEKASSYLPPAAEESAVSSSPEEADDDSTSSSSSSDDGPGARSRVFRRPPRFQAPKKSALGHIESDSDSDSATFLPFAKGIADGTTGNDAHARRPSDLNATIRDATTPRTATDSNSETTSPSNAAGSAPALRDVGAKGKGKRPAHAQPQAQQPQSPSSRVASSTTSDTSSAAVVVTEQTSPASQQSQGPHALRQAPLPHQRVGALSPRHRADLARASPRRRARGTGVPEHSDGTPSMGSSFSDLDDTSITQSALEEALASNLRHGGASRLSNLGQAFNFRSRYM